MKTSFLLFLLLLVTSFAIAMPVISEHTTYYKISGNSADELRAQMNALGPLDKGIRVDAKTTWYITWHYNWHYDNATQNPCYVTDVHVSGEINYLYPEWTNQNQANPGLQAQWNSYLSHLSAHEQGHANNGKKATMEIERALLLVQPQVNCTVLEDTLETTAKNVLLQHNSWDTDYDADTDHGKKQGAIFP